MSTRCQVIVEQEGLTILDEEKPWGEARMLYHHMDGHPENMVHVFTKAYVLSEAGWEAGRAGKVASFLCAADPGQFEPEDNKALHGDIEYFYRLSVINKKNGSAKETPVWRIAVFAPFRKWYDAQIADWEWHKGVSAMEDEPVKLVSFDPYDYKDCINQRAFRRLGTATLQMINDEPYLDMTKQLGKRIRDYASSGY